MTLRSTRTDSSIPVAGADAAVTAAATAELVPAPRMTPAPRRAIDPAEEDRRLAAEDRREAARYLFASYRDRTTGALNRQPGCEQLKLLVDRARREGSPLAFVFLDVDGLKEVNDSQGHASGDALLESLGSALRHGMRSYDVVVRYGGDEFVCALPGSSATAAKARVSQAQSVLGELVDGATVSAGYAELRATDTLDEVIARADKDLYQSRRLEQGPTTGPSTPARSSSPETRRPSVACGACGGRVALVEFVVQLTDRMTRAADCPDCGETTVIELLEPLRRRAATPVVDVR